MAWEDYLSFLLELNLKEKVLQHAAICQIESGTVLASTDGFDIKPEEIIKLVNGKKGSPMNDVFIAGHKCVVIQNNLDEENVFSMQLRSCGCPITVGKTLTVVIVAKGYKDAVAGKISSKVYQTLDHLRQSQC